jgi:calcineurin-like phosphoesterase family protein
MTIFFTSDLHFHHERAREFCPWSRGHWQSTEEMNEGLIAAWNAKVNPVDTVYNLGDFCWKPQFNAFKNILSRLNGHHNIIWGNHDGAFRTRWHQLVEDPALNAKLGMAPGPCDFRKETIADQEIILCHFPLAVWEKNHYGSWNLYGHCHGSYKAFGKQLDVGFDSHDFDGFGFQRGPWSFDEVKQVLDNRAIAILDHHNNRRPVYTGEKG